MYGHCSVKFFPNYSQQWYNMSNQRKLETVAARMNIVPQKENR
jgi:hypothetical protein